MWAAAIPAIAAVGSALIGSNAADKAGDAQAKAAREAAKVQKYMFDKQVELQAPFRSTGLSANNRLAYLLGLSTNPGGTSAAQNSGLTYEDLRNQLESGFTKKVRNPEYDPRVTVDNAEKQKRGYTPPQKYITTIDESALDAEIRKRLAQQQAQQLSQQQAAELTAAQGDQDYGSLMRRFSMDDFEADPGYAFRQQEGMKGIEGGAAARGSLLSGGALKAIQKYGQDLASQEYGNAYGRFNADQTNQYNRLAGVVNTGQGATNQLTNAAGNLGSNLSSNIIGAGNAQAASQIGQANAWNQALGGVSNAYQNNQLMNLIRNPGAGNQPSVESYYGY